MVGRIGAQKKHQKALDSLVIAEQPKDYRIIKLPTGEIVKIDIEDYDLAISYPWRVHKAGKYVTTGGSRTGHLFLHRMIMERVFGRKLTKKDIIDHERHDTFDNRRHRLRLATISLNGANMLLPKRNTSGYKGVKLSRSRLRWHAEIKHMQKMFFIGAFGSKEEAAYAYDQWAMQLFGEFAYTNFDY